MEYIIGSNINASVLSFEKSIPIVYHSLNQIPPIFRLNKNIILPENYPVQNSIDKISIDKDGNLIEHGICEHTLKDSLMFMNCLNGLDYGGGCVSFVNIDEEKSKIYLNYIDNNVEELSFSHLYISIEDGDKIYGIDPIEFDENREHIVIDELYVQKDRHPPKADYDLFYSFSNTFGREIHFENRPNGRGKNVKSYVKFASFLKEEDIHKKDYQEINSKLITEEIGKTLFVHKKRTIYPNVNDVYNNTENITMLPKRYDNKLFKR